LNHCQQIPFETVRENCTHNPPDFLDNIADGPDDSACHLDEVLENFLHGSPVISDILLDDDGDDSHSHVLDDVFENCIGGSPHVSEEVLDRNILQNSLNISEEEVSIQFEEGVENVCSPVPASENIYHDSDNTSSHVVEEFDQNKNDDERDTTFLGLANLASQYSVKKCVEDDIVVRQKNEICALFAQERISHRGQ